MQPPKSRSILRKDKKSLGPTHSVHFLKGASRHMKIRERTGPSQGVIQRTDSHERSPYAPKSEDGSEEETLKHERCARRDAWEMAKGILKEKDKATFFSPSDFWCPPAPSLSKPEERTFVVDSRASLHMLSRTKLRIQRNLATSPENPQRSSQPMEQCKHMRKQQCTSTIWIYS